MSKTKQPNKVSVAISIMIIFMLLCSILIIHDITYRVRPQSLLNFDEYIIQNIVNKNKNNLQLKSIISSI